MTRPPNSNSIFCVSPIKVCNFLDQKRAKLFRVTVSPHQTEYVITNALSQGSTQDTRGEYALRWKIEAFPPGAEAVDGRRVLPISCPNKEKTSLAEVLLPRERNLG